VVDGETKDKTETILSVQCVVQLDVEEPTVDESGRREQQTATTAAHRRADRQVDRLTWSNVVVRPRRETGASQVRAKLSHDIGVLRAVSNEHVVLEPRRTGQCTLNDAQLPQLRVKRLQ